MKENQKPSGYLPPETFAVQQQLSICSVSNLTSGIIDENLTIEGDIDF